MISLSEPRLGPALLGRRRSCRQQPSFPAGIKALTEIVELTKIVHEPVEHAYLHTSDGADLTGPIETLQGRMFTSNP